MQNMLNYIQKSREEGKEDKSNEYKRNSEGKMGSNTELRTRSIKEAQEG